jgi:hypothetical protein
MRINECPIHHRIRVVLLNKPHTASQMTRAGRFLWASCEKRRNLYGEKGLRQCIIIMQPAHARKQVQHWRHLSLIILDKRKHFVGRKKKGRMRELAEPQALLTGLLSTTYVVVLTVLNFPTSTFSLTGFSIENPSLSVLTRQSSKACQSRINVNTIETPPPTAKGFVIFPLQKGQHSCNIFTIGTNHHQLLFAIKNLVAFAVADLALTCKRVLLPNTKAKGSFSSSERVLTYD